MSQMFDEILPEWLTVDWFVDFLAAPHNYIYFFIAWLIPVGLLWWLRRGNNNIRAVTTPLVLFAKRMSGGATKGYDQLVMSMFHPQLLKSVERGIIRAAARCINKELGEYRSIDESSIVAKEGHTNQFLGKLRAYVVSAKIRFALQEATMEIRYAKLPTSRKAAKDDDNTQSSGKDNDGKSSIIQILGFNVSRVDGVPLRIYNYLDPDDFELYGYRFAQSLLTTKPLNAISMMNASLAAKYNGDAEVLAQQAKKVLTAAGGVKKEANGEVDTSFVGGKLIRQVIPVGGNSSETKEVVVGVSLEYTTPGQLRQIHCTVDVTMNETPLKVAVSRYCLQVNKDLSEKHVIVDQETGATTHLN